MTNNILLTVTPVSEGRYLCLRINVPSIRRKFSFYVEPSFFASFAEAPADSPRTMTVTDLHNVLTIRPINGDPQLHFMFIESSFSGRITGHETYLRITWDTLNRLASGESFHVLVHGIPETPDAPITFSDSAMHRIAAFDASHRRAFFKCLRSHFHWEGSRITVYADFGNDFCFVETVNGRKGICGGINCSRKTVTGRDGNRYPAIEYSVNT